MQFKLTQECGQKWYRLSSWWVWRPHPYKQRLVKNGMESYWVPVYHKVWLFKFRLLGPKRYRIGIAFGPIMLFWRFE